MNDRKEVRTLLFEACFSFLLFLLTAILLTIFYFLATAGSLQTHQDVFKQMVDLIGITSIMEVVVLYLYCEFFREQILCLKAYSLKII